MKDLIIIVTLVFCIVGLCVGIWSLLSEDKYATGQMPSIRIVDKDSNND